MARQVSTRGRKPKPGRIVFVGSGPGDPGLLTTRARAALARAAVVFTDPDVPEPILALVGTDLPPAPIAAPTDGKDAAGKDAKAAAETADGKDTATAAKDTAKG